MYFMGHVTVMIFQKASESSCIHEKMTIESWPLNLLSFCFFMYSLIFECRSKGLLIFLIHIRIFSELLKPWTTTLHRGRRPWQNRILILVFFRLRAQFYTYKNTLDILQVFPSGWTCLKLCFSSKSYFWKDEKKNFI